MWSWSGLDGEKAESRQKERERARRSVIGVESSGTLQSSPNSSKNVNTRAKEPSLQSNNNTPKKQNHLHVFGLTHCRFKHVRPTTLLSCLANVLVPLLKGEVLEVCHQNLPKLLWSLPLSSS